MDEFARDAKRCTKQFSGHGCAAQFFLARMPSGSRMPLSIREDQAGNVAVYRDATGQPSGRVLRKDEQLKPYERRYMPHFATCIPHIAEEAHKREARAVEKAARRAGA